MEEIWIPIIGYEESYQISNYGNVKSLAKTWFVGRKRTSYISKPDSIIYKRTDKDGYRFVSLRKDLKTKYFKIHRLVAIHFIENPDNKKEVNHIDCDKSNNFILNLEWCTSLENTKHAKINNLIKSGIDCSWISPVSQYSLDGILIKNWNFIKQAADSLNLNKDCISSACSGVQKTSGGFIWKYRKAFN